MDLKNQKKLASRILKIGKARIWIDPARIADASEAITSADINNLVKKGIIKIKKKKGVSRSRAKKLQAQKKKGRRKGQGSRKGKLGTRMPKKRLWMKQVRVLRKFLAELRDEGKIEKSVYRKLYRKAKSGFFRSKSHIKNYIEKNNLLKGEESEKLQKKKA